MSDSAATGVGPNIEFKGVRYSLSPMTAEMLGEINEFSADYAWRSAARTKRFCTQEEYAERLDATTRLINSGAYAWHTPRGQEVMQTLEGRAFELFLKLKVKHPEVTLDFARRILDEQVEEALAKMAQADFDPNPGRGSEPSPETQASTPATPIPAAS